MAYVDITGKTESSISGRVAGLDANYENSIRSLYWKIYRGTTLVKSTSEYMSNRISETPIRTWSGLDPDTYYKVEATITNINDGTYPDVVLYDYVWTDPASGTPLVPPTFTLYQVTQDSVKVDFSMPAGATECGIFVDYGGEPLTIRDLVVSTSYSPYTVTKLSAYHNDIALQPGTTYTVGMDSYNANTGEASSISRTKDFTTDPVASLPTPTLNTTGTYVTDTSIEVEANIVSNIDYYYFELYNSSLSYLTYKRTASIYALFSGLAANTSYYVRLKVQKAGYADSAWSGWYNIYTGLPVLGAPTFDTTQTQRTHNTISVKANAVANAQYYYFELYNDAQTTRLAYQNATSLTAYFSGLTAGTQYKIRVKVTTTGYEESAWSSWYAVSTTIAQGWNWWHSTLTGDAIALTRDEWIAFQNKINEVRTGLGYAAYTFTTSTAEIFAGKPIKATHVNETILATNTMLSSLDDMSTVISGDPITSAKMIEMKDKLNSCIA